MNIVDSKRTLQKQRAKNCTATIWRSIPEWSTVRPSVHHRATPGKSICFLGKPRHQDERFRAHAGNVNVVPAKARMESALRQKYSLWHAFPHLTSAALWSKWRHAKFAPLFAVCSAGPHRRPLALVRIVAEATSGPGSSSDINDLSG